MYNMVTEIGMHIKEGDVLVEKYKTITNSNV